MSELISVFGDLNTDGGGGLLASNNSSKVFINGLKVVYVSSAANPDALCPIAGGAHCAPSAVSGSGKVFSEGFAIHRNNDLRACGALTIVSGQAKVTCG